MTRLAWRLAFGTGRGRAALLACCTAVVSGLLLVTVAVLSLPASPAEALFSVVADPGTRGGYAFGTALLSVPPLLLLHQAVRLGTSARERRLAALRLAGATPGDVRRIGAVEVGVPAFLGAVGGIGVYWVLRILLGGATFREDFGAPDGYTLLSARLVPTSVTPAWWQILAIVVAVSALGVAVGLLAGRRVIVTPLGVTRRTTRRPPRPWGALLILAGFGLGLALVSNAPRPIPDEFEMLTVFSVIGLPIIGIVSLAPWTAYVVGRSVAARARTGPVLLAARRLAGDPRPAGRAAAAVGGIGLIGGGSAAVLADLLAADWEIDNFYFVSLALIAAALITALLAVVGSLAVHSVESLLDRKRSVAALAALGVPKDMLIRAQRWEAGLVAIPMSIGGMLLGSLVGSVHLGTGAVFWWLSITALALASTVGLVWFAIWAAVRLTRPWTLRTADPANLRTE